MADVTMKVNLTNCSLDVQDSNGKVLQTVKADTKTVTLVSGDIYIFVLKSDDGYIFDSKNPGNLTYDDGMGDTESHNFDVLSDDKKTAKKNPVGDSFNTYQESIVLTARAIAGQAEVKTPINISVKCTNGIITITDSSNNVLATVTDDASITLQDKKGKVNISVSSKDGYLLDSAYLDIDGKKNNLVISDSKKTAELKNIDFSASTTVSLIVTTIISTSPTKSTELEKIKNYLRLDTDLTNDDDELKALLAGARKYIEKTTNKIYNDDDELMELCKMLLVSHWYTNRSIVSKSGIVEYPYSITSLLEHFLTCSDYDGGGNK
jgi:uncharacterized phage protein (predicted DNA packaging)